MGTARLKLSGRVVPKGWLATLGGRDITQM